MVNPRLPAPGAVMTNWLTRSLRFVGNQRNSLANDALAAGRALTPFIASRCPREALMVSTGLRMRKNSFLQWSGSVLHYQPKKALGETTATALPPPNGSAQKPHVLLVQTQAENAGAQEISRLLGAGLTSRGYRVTNLFFFRKSDSFDEPPDTLYCASSRPGNPLALLQMLWTLGGHIRATRPDAVLTFQHFGNVIGAGVARLICRAPVIANQVSSALSMSWPVRMADIAMGSLGFFDRITLNSLDMQREYSRYPRAYRARMVHVPHGFDDKALTLSKQAARQKLISRRIAPCSAAQQDYTRTSGSTRRYVCCRINPP